MYSIYCNLYQVPIGSHSLQVLPPPWPSMLPLQWLATSTATPWTRWRRWCNGRAPRWRPWVCRQRRRSWWPCKPWPSWRQNELRWELKDAVGREKWPGKWWWLGWHQRRSSWKMSLRQHLRCEGRFFRGVAMVLLTGAIFWVFWIRCC